MKAVLSFFLWCLALLLLGLFSWALTLYLNWPYWGGLAIFFGIIGLYFGVKLLRRLWIVARSRVRLAASEASGRKATEASSHLAALTGKWKEGIATLRQSSLRRFGNPVYALPWFMVVGESGAGKTSSITRSHLTSLNKRISQFDPIVKTLNCDWWFFNRAVVIDTAGRYVSPSGTSDDIAEWERMLELLAKYRMKQGLDGLVLTIDTEQLLSGDQESLDRHGHVIRERIDQLIRLFDKRFPIYVLVTKCDRIYGFDAWTQALPVETRHQAMGYVGPLEQGDGAESRFLDTALDKITTRLKYLRLDMAVKGMDMDAGLLLFPAELERLRGGLQRFLNASMGNTPYLEQPLLRGLFLSSARQDGAALPSALAHLMTAEPSSAPSEQGLFLQDFFERVLPADRGTFLPTIIVNRWRQVTRDLAAVFWISIFAAALVFVLVSYYQTRKSLQEIHQLYPAKSIASADTQDERLRTLRQILQMIDLILDREDAWQTRWLAFSPDITALEEDIKAAYVRGYQNFVGMRSNNALIASISSLPPDDPMLANAVLAMARNINLTQARIKGADYRQLLAMPQMPPQVAQAMYRDLPPDIINSSHRMIVAYKAWSRPNDPVLLESLERDRAVLTQILAQAPHLEWLLPWANALPQLKPVTLREFWLPGSQGKNDGPIAPSLTQQGELALKSFLDELGLAFDRTSDFQVKRGAFEAWYEAERFNAWQRFAWSFTQGEQLLSNESAWREMITRIDTRSSPYYLFFERLRQEFIRLPVDRLPAWLRFSRDFSGVWRIADTDNTVGKAGALLNTINTVGERVIHQVVDQRSLDATSMVQSTIQGVQTYKTYAQQFDEAAADVLGGDGKAYQLAADYFGIDSDPQVKTSLLQTAQDSLATFRKVSGYDQADDQVIWQLVGGPLALLTRYALEQASCNIQHEWERAVLWKTQMAVSAREINDQLFGEKGSVWAFADGPAKPFLVQRQDGFSVARKNGYQLPFNTGFTAFLNTSVDTRVESVVKSQQAEASLGKSANLLITARPIGVNPGARAKPYAVNLSIHCASEDIALDNFNMQTTTSFDWSPDQCGDVTLQIRIDNLTLTRRYPGPMGMARFISEFADGQRVFTPDDFPNARQRLEELDVSALYVRYDFVGQDALLNLADHIDYLAQTTTPSISATPAHMQIRVPERVGQCWTGGIPSKSAAPVPLYIQQRAKQIIAAPPAPKPAPQPATTPAAPKPATRTHRVQEGETLYSLSRRYGTSVDALQALNHLKNTDLIVSGQTLQIPAQAAATP